MPCEHVGPPELIAMAEEHLKGRGVETARWAGAAFRWSENVASGVWAAVTLEVERRGEEWIVTRIDRFREPLPESATGFQVLADAS
jgi:hypothetical protein